MATLVHDDLIDGAAVRRGRAAAWAAHGAEAARAAGDYLFARAFAELAADGDVRGRRGPRRRVPRARARRGDAAPPAPRPRHDGRRVPRALRAEDGEALRGGLLARLGRVARRRSGSTLGIAFQIADDILDCAGDDDRDRARWRAPTCARGRRRCRSSSPRARTRSFARRSRAARSRACSSASPRPARSTRSREVALDYAGAARASLNGEPAPGGARGARRRRRRPEDA